MKTPFDNPKLEEQIDLYLSGSLNRQETDLLWEQLVEYPHYLDYLKTLVSLRHIGEEEKVEIDHTTKLPNNETSRYDFRYAIAASFVLLLSVVSILVIFPKSSDDPIQPLAVLELSNLRSSALSENEFEREIQRGISLAVLGKELEALEVLHELYDNTDNEELRLDVMINIGIVQYNMADYESAKSTFLTITQNPQAEPLLEEKAWWYLANTYLKSNHREDAKIAAQHVYDVNGAYRRMAARWL
ncbi:MAG: hypothetical protein WD098_00255, partial [Balneolales bacterium]